VILGKRWIEWVGTVAVVAAALVAAEARFFFGNSYHFGGQFADSYALHRLASQSIRAGELPQWFPNLLCGYPLHAALAVSPFYPPATLLLALNPTYRLFELYAILHLLVGGVTMAILLRTLGCAWGARTLGAVCYAACGFNLAQLGHTASFAIPAAWMPLVLVAWRRLARELTLRRAAVTSVASAVVLLEGHLQLALYGLVFGSAWFAWNRFSMRGDGVRLRRSLGLWLLSLVLALSIAGPRLLPSAAFLRETAPPEEESQEISPPLQARELLALPWPDLLRATSQAQENRAAVETYAYVGMLPLLLAILGAPRRQGLFFAGSALISLAAASGVVESLNGLLSHVGLPGIRSQTRPLLVFDLSVAVLAGLGFDRLRTLPRKRVRSSSAGCAALLLLAAALTAVWGGRSEDGLREYVLAAVPGCAFLLLTVLIVGLLSKARTAAFLLLLVVDLSYFSARLPQPFEWQPEKTFIQYRRRPLRDLATIVPAPRVHTAPLTGLSNAPLLAGLHTTTAWVGWRRAPWRYAALLGELGSYTESHDELLPLLSAPYVLVERSKRSRPAFASLPVEGLTGAFELLRYDKALPRAYVAHAIRAVPSWHQALHIFRTGDVDPQTEAVVELPDTASDSVRWAAGGRDSVVFLDYENNRLVLEATLCAPGVLVALETYYPGWTAKVDGEAVPVLPAQIAFRGVPLEAGRHVVEMRFWDPYLTVGLALSAPALAAVAVLALASPRARGAAHGSRDNPQ
jgi:hypothetical protein